MVPNSDSRGTPRSLTESRRRRGTLMSVESSLFSKGGVEMNWALGRSTGHQSLLVLLLLSLLTRPVGRPLAQAEGLLPQLSLPGEVVTLCAAGGRQDRMAHGRIVPACRLHRNQSGQAFEECREVLQRSRRPASLRPEANANLQCKIEISGEVARRRADLKPGDGPFNGVRPSRHEKMPKNHHHALDAGWGRNGYNGRDSGPGAVPSQSIWGIPVDCRRMMSV